MNSENEQIFREIYEANSRWLYQYIYRQIGDAPYAEDIFQEVAVALLFHLGNFQAGYPDNAKQVRAWLCGVAKNKLKHFWRKEYRALKLEVSTELVPELVDRRTEITDGELALPEWLEPMDQKLLSLRVMGYSLKEIAGQLGITYAACRMRSSRLMGELKKYFEK